MTSLTFRYSKWPPKVCQCINIYEKNTNYYISCTYYDLACEIHCNICLHVWTFNRRPYHMDSNPSPPSRKGERRHANGQSNSSNAVKVCQTQVLKSTYHAGFLFYYKNSIILLYNGVKILKICKL